MQNCSRPSSRPRLTLADAHNLISPLTLDTCCFNYFFSINDLHSLNVFFSKESLAIPPGSVRFITD